MRPQCFRKRQIWDKSADSTLDTRRLSDVNVSLRLRSGSISKRPPCRPESKRLDQIRFDNSVPSADRCRSIVSRGLSLSDATVPADHAITTSIAGTARVSLYVYAHH